jgi:HNH endonuclease
LGTAPAPFASGNGEPHKETHHIVWPSQVGEDTVDNTVARCPNCHRRMHDLNLPADQVKLKNLLNHTRRRISRTCVAPDFWFYRCLDFGRTFFSRRNSENPRVVGSIPTPATTSSPCF